MNEPWDTWVRRVDRSGLNAEGHRVRLRRWPDPEACSKSRAVSAPCYEMARSLRVVPGTTLVAIGNFDGVHRGHQKILCAAGHEAKRRGLTPVVLTFFPHPVAVVNNYEVPLLTDICRRAELIRGLDPELRVVVEEFTLALAESRPEAFVRELLVGCLGAKVVTVGQNFRFGRGRSGNLDTLRALGLELGFEATVHEIVGDSSGPYSSSRARAALGRGDLDAFQRVVGRPHALTGKVVQGDRRGRTLGAPTANLDGIAEALPAHGIYAGMAVRLDGSSVLPLGPTAVNVGTRPTFGTNQPNVEAHIIGFEGDLYGQTLRLHLTHRLRPEQRFSTVEDLRVQIHKDIALAAEVVDPSAVFDGMAPCNQQ